MTKGGDIMYNTLFTAFMDTLNREGKIVYDYRTNTPYNVIFRRNTTKNSFKDFITIFYPVDSNIHTGELITYSDTTYLVINKETAENGVYYKSDMLQINTTLTRFKNNEELVLPVYSSDVNSALINAGEIISMQDGNVEMLTEDNDLLNSADEFYSIGQYWEINNLIHKNNILYIYSKVTAQPQNHTLTVTINANDTYIKGDSVKLTATAKYGDMEINNAQIAWNIDNSSIATINTDGTLNCIAEGNVIITATWVSQNVSAEKSITVGKPIQYTISINADDSYTVSDTPTLTATTKQDGTEVTGQTITWASSDSNIATIDSTGKVNCIAVGSVTFTATWVEHNVSATKDITVKAKAEPLTITMTDENGNTSGFYIKTYASWNFTGHFWNGTVENTSVEPDWSFTPPAGYESDLSCTFDGLVATIKVLSNGSKLIGKTCTLTLQDKDHTATLTEQVSIKGAI
jgi:uncharacterized protein YjdB